MGQRKEQDKAVKRYYWLKLKEEFFLDKEVKKLRKIAGGDTYTIIYLKLMLLSLKTDGRLYFDGIEETFHEELALEMDEDPENVRVTMMYLEKMGLLKLVNEDELFLTQMENLIESESESAQRVREHRARKKLLDSGLEPNAIETNSENINGLPNKEGNETLQCNNNVTECNDTETKCNTYTDTYTDTKTNTKKIHTQEVEDFFESLWSLYIRKEGKSAVSKKAKEEIFAVGYDRMKACIDRYAREKAGTEKQYILMGSTFFNGRYKDYLVTESPKKVAPVKQEPEEEIDEAWQSQFKDV